MNYDLHVYVFLIVLGFVVFDVVVVVVVVVFLY